MFPLIRVFISLGLLCMLFWIMREEYGKIYSQIRSTYLPLFVLAWCMYNMNICLITLRLRTLLKSEKIKMPFFKLLELTYIGFFFNNFMPSAIGGDIVKAYYAGTITKEKAKSYVSVFMDRLTGLFSFAIIGCVALVIGWNAITEPTVKRSVILFIIMCGTVAMVALNAKIARMISKVLSKVHFKNIGEKLLKVYNMLHSYKNRLGVIWKTIGISMIAQASYFTVMFILFRASHSDIPYNVVFIIMPLVCVITMLPSLGGLGLREGAIVALFGPFVGADKAFGVGLLLFGILFTISIMGAIIYMVSPQFRKVKLEENLGEEDLI